jgi:hypothetical protein
MCSQLSHLFKIARNNNNNKKSNSQTSLTVKHIHVQLIKPNQTKPNQTKPNQTKPNQTKPNQTKFITDLSLVQFVSAMHSNPNAPWLASLALTSSVQTLEP